MVRCFHHHVKILLLRRHKTRSILSLFSVHVNTCSRPEIRRLSLEAYIGQLIGLTGPQLVRTIHQNYWITRSTLQSVNFFCKPKFETMPAMSRVRIGIKQAYTCYVYFTLTLHCQCVVNIVSCTCRNAHLAVTSRTATRTCRSTRRPLSSSPPSPSSTPRHR